MIRLETGSPRDSRAVSAHDCMCDRMTCTLTEQELWSGLDRHSVEIKEHLAECPTCQAKADEYNAGISALAEACTPRIDAPPPAIPDRIGHYTIISQLGAGGMGIVYAAKQQTPERVVAIKVIRGGAAADEYHVRLFRREAQTLARLKHPSIAAVYEAGRTDEGEHFIVMELVVGEPLTDYVRSRPVSRRGRLALFRKICDALTYAHQRGIIHRDLKPSNILVDEQGNPKILDFGLARVSDSEAVRTTMTDVAHLMGTLPYMSPEEARGEPGEVDIRSDIYALGVVLFELLTDQLPYTVKRTALPQAIKTICEDPPLRPSVVDRSLRGDLETIVLKALEKTPERRYQTVGMLGEDIDRFQADQPILARPAGGLYRFRKFAIRHKLFFVFLAALVGVTITTSVFVAQLERERRASRFRLFDSHDLMVASIENQLAQVHRSDGKFDQAEPHFRKALVTYRRLERDQRTARTLLALAGLLVDRNLASANDPEFADYDEAEALLQEAIVIFERNLLAWRDERTQTLKILRILYGPRVWDEQELASEVDRALIDLEAQAEALDSQSME